VYLLEAGFSETDTNPVVLPYYNVAAPAIPFLGPANEGTAQPTARVQRVQLQLKAGEAAPAGTAMAPAADSGFVGVATVTVNAGATEIDATNITALPAAPIVPFKLPNLRPGFTSIAAYAASAIFTVPANVTRAKITVIGGGGAGGSDATLPGGGGGAGGQAIVAIDYLVPGTQLPITVGAGGVAVAGAGFGPGGNGGTSSFGTIVSATGGIGGGAALGASAYTGGNGGQGVGGTIDSGGSWGTDGIPAGSRGGDGGGPGAGRGATLAPGLPAAGFGGGGGGGAPGYAGANGASGLVVVEY
jgi:hypothetical protein